LILLSRLKSLFFHSVSPVPPILPSKQLKLDARHQYVYGLLVAALLTAGGFCAARDEEFWENLSSRSARLNGRSCQSSLAYGVGATARWHGIAPFFVGAFTTDYERTSSGAVQFHDERAAQM
jgi:hypothetical protein